MKYSTLLFVNTQSFYPTYKMANNSTNAKAPFSKWWPIGCAIACVVLYIIGGAVNGSACASDVYGDIFCNFAQADAGLALLIIASLLFIATIVLLIIYLIKRPKHVIVINQNGLSNTHAASDVPMSNVEAQPTKQGHPAAYGQPMSPAPQYTQQAQTTHVPQQNVGNGNEMSAGGRACRNCEMTGVQSPFCPRCGATM